jgi:hypothetical protein
VAQGVGPEFKPQYRNTYVSTHIQLREHPQEKGHAALKTCPLESRGIISAEFCLSRFQGKGARSSGVLRKPDMSLWSLL